MSKNYFDEEVVHIKPILEVKNLSISFTQYTNGLRQHEINVVNDLNIDIYPGEVLAILGSSGSGKSLLAHAIFGVLPSNAKVEGEIYYEGDLLTEKRLESLRGKEMAFVPQTVNSLDPLMKVGAQAQISVKEGDKVKAQKEVFSRYNLEPHVGGLYPFQMSGGMARRVLVSTAVLSKAKLIVADEPTPGMDPEAINETLNYLHDLVDNGSSVMMIIHDIETALRIADRIAILYAGTVIEVANKDDFTGNGDLLRHPYTKALWKALPQNGFNPIDGSQPLTNEIVEGCLFAPRCHMATEECTRGKIKTRKTRDGIARCIYATGS